MKLYYAPGACSLGIHVMLEEIGQPYETEAVDLRNGKQYDGAFVAVTAKSKVPVLRLDDGSVLTEYGAIATWLGRTHPAAKLIPSDPAAEARAVEAMDYIVATVHMQGFTRIARPTNFAPNPADTEAVKARGREIYLKGLGILDGDACRARVVGRRVLDGGCGFVLRRTLARTGRGGTAAARCRPPCPHAGPPGRAARDGGRGAGGLSMLPARAFWFLRHGETDWNAEGRQPGPHGRPAQRDRPGPGGGGGPAAAPPRHRQHRVLPAVARQRHGAGGGPGVGPARDAAGRFAGGRLRRARRHHPACGLVHRLDRRRVDARRRRKLRRPAQPGGVGGDGSLGRIRRRCWWSRTARCSAPCGRRWACRSTCARRTRCRSSANRASPGS